MKIYHHAVQKIRRRKEDSTADSPVDSFEGHFSR